MKYDSELALAVNAKFDSIVKEIQQSNLNYLINLTPYAAYVTLKKSSQLDINGSQALPSPPALSLREKLNSESEIECLQTKIIQYEKQYDDLLKENGALKNELHVISESFFLLVSLY